MKVKPFIFSLYGWTYWLPPLLAGLVAAVTFAAIGNWWLVGLAAVITLAILAFFRDPPRAIPQDPGLMVSPADGKLTHIEVVPNYAPFNGPALRVSIFLSVLDVHVNRMPCAGAVLWSRYEEGLFLDARHADCAIKNQSNLICLADDAGQPVVTVKQIVGAIARRIIAPVENGQKFERGERYGMIAFGSRTEIYVPHPEKWQPQKQIGDHVAGGRDILLKRK